MQTPGKRKNLISRVTRLTYSNVQKKSQKAYKEIRKYSPFKGKKLTDRNHPQENPDIRLIKQKSFKYVQRDKGKHRHLKEEIRKMIYKQNENINKRYRNYKKEPTKNSGAELKFMRRVQQQV